MAARVSKEKVELISELISSGESNQSIASQMEVSVSYVNKLRNGLNNSNGNVDNKSKKSEDVVNNKIEKSEEERFQLTLNEMDYNEIDVLEIKISSLEQTLKWYKELLEFKKNQKK